MNLLAKYFAIIDLVNANHASVWHNLRFYYDPFQSKLIPIGFNKKNEYSGSSSKINFLKTNNNKFNYLLANPSSLIMNNLIYEANSENKTISNLIYK